MSTVRANAILDASGGNTATINSMTPTADSLQGFRNRIINGDMGINQRGGTVNNTAAANTYGVDRFAMYGADASKMSAQQSTTAPTGFVNSWLITSSAATTPSAAQPYGIRQVVEGRNISDLGWGTANAKTITISFWVRSSITGTYALSLFNRDAPNRSYVATYTISSANTFEYKTITIAGDTSGTWDTDNGQGIQVWWDLGSGSNFNETAGSWVSALKVRTSGSSNWVGTSGATFYITGVQLEVGSVATSFERIDYGRELQLCYRYFYKYENTTGGGVPLSVWQAYSSTGAFGNIITFPVVMRATPTASTSGTFILFNATGSTSLSVTSFNVDRMTPYSAGSNGSSVATGLTAGDATALYTPNNGSISFAIEL
jgi:hypothetical protein